MKYIFHRYNSKDGTKNKGIQNIGNYLVDKNRYKGDYYLYLDSKEKLYDFGIKCILPELRRVWNIIVNKKSDLNSHVLSFLQRIGELAVLELDAESKEITYLTWLFRVAQLVNAPFETYFREEGAVYCDYKFTAISPSHLNTYMQERS